MDQITGNLMEPIDVFEVLVRENAGMLSAYIRAGLGSREAVDDIWQETMLTAWRRWDDYDHERPFGAWLRGIAGKNILAWHRKHSRGTVTCDEATLEYFQFSFSQLNHLAGDTFDEKLSALRSCIASLPQEYQISIRLRYEVGLKPAAMAKNQNRKLSTVKKQLMRAKAMLLRCINRKIEHAVSTI